MEHSPTPETKPCARCGRAPRVGLGFYCAECKAWRVTRDTARRNNRRMAKVRKMLNGAGPLLLLGLLLGGPARAADYEALWRNTDPARPAKWVRMCDAKGCTAPVATSCAPGAECRTVFTDMPANRMVWAMSSEDGVTWSAPSNQVATDACLASAACRFDIDRSGSITVLDFAAFLRVMGTSYR